MGIFQGAIQGLQTAAASGLNDLKNRAVKQVRNGVQGQLNKLQAGQQGGRRQTKGKGKNKKNTKSKSKSKSKRHTRR